MQLFNNKYGLREWITLIFGCIIIAIQILRYSFDNLGNNMVEVVVFIAGFLLIFAPKAMVEILKRKIK